MDKEFYHMSSLKSPHETATTFYKSGTTTGIISAHNDMIVVHNMLEVANKELRKMTEQMCKSLKSSAKDY
jgi:hypothetical protein